MVMRTFSDVMSSVSPFISKRERWFSVATDDE